MFYTAGFQSKSNLKSSDFKQGVGFYYLKITEYNQEYLVYIDKMNDYPYFLNPWNIVSQKIKNLFVEGAVEKNAPTKVESKGLVSEDFVLKIFAIANNREKFNDLKQ